MILQIKNPKTPPNKNKAGGLFVYLFLFFNWKYNEILLSHNNNEILSLQQYG